MRYGLGLRWVLSDEAREASGFAFDEVLFHLRDAWDHNGGDDEFASGFELRDFYDDSVPMVSQRDVDPPAGVFVARNGEGGPLPLATSREVRAALGAVELEGTIPDAVRPYPPRTDARVLVPQYEPDMQHEYLLERPDRVTVRSAALALAPGHPMNGVAYGALRSYREALRAQREAMPAEGEWADATVSREVVRAAIEKLEAVVEVAERARVLLVLVAEEPETESRGESRGRF